MHFALHDGAINTERFIDLLAALVNDARPKKVFLILDNLRVHKAGEMQAWLESRKRQIEVFYLPPYTPEANPDEMLNRDIKTTLRSQAPAKDRFELRGLARSFMARLQSAPERIKRYFQHVSVRYAADLVFDYRVNRTRMEAFDVARSSLAQNHAYLLPTSDVVPSNTVVEAICSDDGAP